MRQVRLGGLTFDGGLARHTSFTLASFSRSVDMHRPSVKRPHSAGSFGGRGSAGEQEFSWSGLILTDSEYKQDHAIWQLSGLLSDGELGQLTLEDTDTRWVNVQRGEIPAPRVLVPGRVAAYQVSVSAPDPHLFGDLNEVGPASSVDVFHRGSVASTPTIRVTGSMPSGYTINGPGGRQFVVSQALTSGQTHEIRMGTGWLFRNGVLQRTAVTRAQTWDIPPGVVVPMSLVPVSGSGQMSVLTPDAFM